MWTCSRCSLFLPDIPECCPRCGGDAGDDAGGPSERPFVLIYRAPDELAAISVRHFLEDAGIRCWVRSIQIPWYDSIMRTARGYWGDVLVAEGDRDEAAEVVGAYLRSLEPGA